MKNRALCLPTVVVALLLSACGPAIVKLPNGGFELLISDNGGDEIETSKTAATNAANTACQKESKAAQDLHIERFRADANLTHPGWRVRYRCA